MRSRPLLSGIDRAEIAVRAHERAQNDRIWKFVMQTPGETGTFEVGSFLRFGPEESVLRHDICISTMAGCPLKCTMCAIPYSSQPFQRRLTADEIERQVRFAIQKRQEEGTFLPMHTVGFMGNGEPFGNYDAVFEAARRILESEIALRSMTASTTGVRPELIRSLAHHPFGASGIGKIQYSLMSMDPGRREALIPIGEGLKVCLPHLDHYARQTGQPIKYNVALIDGMNDSDQEAEALARFIGQAPHLRRVKISTFNPFPGVEMRPSPAERIAQFVQRLVTYGIDVKRFYGDVDQEVFASCGQLRAKIDHLL